MYINVVLPLYCHLHQAAADTLKYMHATVLISNYKKYSYSVYVATVKFSHKAVTGSTIKGPAFGNL